jgi:hypothetical protein
MKRHNRKSNIIAAGVYTPRIDLRIMGLGKVVVVYRER